jgi:AcrR family transcriptional regulator
MGTKAQDKSADVSDGRQYTTPFNDPLDSLTVSAQKIIEAASWLLVTSGYDALTHERIAEVAGVNKSSIRNNFGSKAAVVTAVVDAMIHDGCMELSRTLAGVEASERVRRAVQGIRELVRADAFAGFFDVLPHARRDPELRARLTELYHWWYDETRQWLGMLADASVDPEKARLQLGVARIITAIIDGLLIQLSIEVIPEDADISSALDALSIMLRAVIED